MRVTKVAAKQLVLKPAIQRFALRGLLSSVSKTPLFASGRVMPSITKWAVAKRAKLVTKRRAPIISK